jgi:hypothetical protein
MLLRRALTTTCQHRDAAATLDAAVTLVSELDERVERVECRMATAMRYRVPAGRHGDARQSTKTSPAMKGGVLASLWVVLNVCLA